MMAATLELRWAFLEGFSRYPDLALRGHVTRLLNARGLSLTTGGVDLSVGKRFAVAGTFTVLPYAGANLAWVAGRSGRVDFDPDRSPEQALTSAEAALVNTAVFAPVRGSDNMNLRVYLGLRLGVGVLRVGVEASLTTFGSIDAPDPDDPTLIVQRDLPALGSLGTSIGLSY
jgi:hypothetical protein